MGTSCSRLTSQPIADLRRQPKVVVAQIQCGFETVDDCGLILHVPTSAESGQPASIQASTALRDHLLVRGPNLTGSGNRPAATIQSRVLADTRSNRWRSDLLRSCEGVGICDDMFIASSV
jgi:hypothetical protein